MEISDDMDKSWDHPWTTDEMRKKRREWSLAGDAGLLKHLHQFSENLRSKINKTQETLDVLTTRLTETAILIDNVTNTSLALANTQFIESRVQDDDVEMEKKAKMPIEETKDQDVVTADLIASVSESVKKGLDIMDEKYRQMEVVDSDSDGEDDAIVLSVILGLNNPYQDRPLPYVIDSDKWKNSTKVGLESSSSESEQIDEEDEKLESDKNNCVFDMNAMPKVNVTRLSSSFSESDTYNHRNNISHIKSDKLDTESENINSLSESPLDNGSKGSLVNTVAPSFAEELAKRLGSVKQVEKSIRVDEQNEESINRLRDDLFAAEDEDNSFQNKADNIFTAGKQFFNDAASSNSWKEKPIKSYKSNIIPASVDVPPPISAVSTKPKSAIDDLFGDVDSEDSDDIFSSKNTVRKISKDSGSKNRASTEDPKNKYLNLAAPTSNIATSTPEMNANASHLFSDEEDVADLFSTARVQQQKSTDLPTPSKKKLPGSISILGNISASDIEGKALNRVPRVQSSESSSSDDTPPNDESTHTSETATASSRNLTFSDNIDDRSPIVQPRNNVESLATTNESSYSSGISIQPPSSNNTGGSSIGVDFQPQMTSTRLKSEEIYRERIASDSLFGARSRNPVDNSTNSNTASNPMREERLEDTSSIQQDDVFDNEDLFGPPPLPKSDSKQTKSKVPSLFDDSDSGDELFSTPSSGSRSQKSTDFLATTPQYPDKFKTIHRRGLFDEEINIFSSKDSPDVDIFGITSKLSNAKEKNNSSTRSVLESSSDLFKSVSRESSIAKDNRVAQTQRATQKMSLFDDDDDDEGSDLFSSKLIKTDIKCESQIFKNDDVSDLFFSKESTIREKPFSVDNNGKNPVVKDRLGHNMSIDKPTEKPVTILSEKGLFSTDIPSSNLIFEDDDYDGLFVRKTTSETNKAKEERSEVQDATISTMHNIHNRDKAEFKESQRSTVVSKAVDTFQDPDVLVENVLSTSAEPSNANEEAIAINKVTDSTKDIETETSKKSPPKTLDIQGDISTLLPNKDSKGQRRGVSGKIKNLMGKMSDLKILSPMDTPPLSRRSEEKTDEEDSTADRDSDDGGCMSVPGPSTPSSISESSAVRKESQLSTASGGETAISFDEPAQVETLSTEASKTRVRIQAKRRPQSRHARKSALKQSGMDFDTVDSSENNSHKEDRSSNDVNPVHTNPDPSSIDRLIVSANDNNQRMGDSSISLGIDDKSELGSLSKESSVSANKNTLLSPSTDEEDLFDVPPDLPEDPQKEDSLFGRAPILSPVDRVLSGVVPSNFKPLRDTHISGTEGNESDIRKKSVEQVIDAIKSKDDHLVKKSKQERKESVPINTESNTAIQPNEEPTDPLRDSSHDPLKDPSQLFAFVTKTPSPEKGKNLLFSEDDSLFSSALKKPREDAVPKKQILDLFADDTEGDLFSAPLAKPVKKPLKDTKNSLFDDDNPDDDDGSLFGTIAKKQSTRQDSHKSTSVASIQKKTSLFEDDNNDVNIFGDQSEPSQKSNSPKVSETSKIDSKKVPSVKDIFGDQSSGEDDIFTSKPVSRRKPTSKSLFMSDDEDDSGPIFGASSSYVGPIEKTSESRSSIKKFGTRDLKKTAEKIVEDPLSLLQND